MSNPVRSVATRWRGPVTTVAVLLLSVAVVVARARRRFADDVRSTVDEIHADTGGESDADAGDEIHADTGDESDADAGDGVTGRYTSEAVADLPDPVRRYFEAVLEEAQPSVRRCRLEQRGAFRLGGPGAAWLPLRATQHVTTDPPGFVWDATVRIGRLFPVRVLDAYCRGDGLLRARLLGALPVASAGPSPEMNRGELLRYLAEAVWVPTALLPARGVEWDPIDDRSARATLVDGDVSASVVFHFGDDDLIERVTTVRYRQEAGAYEPWVGYFREYEARAGMLVPTEAEVAWDLPDGELSYWRATVEGVEYETGPSTA